VVSVYKDNLYEDIVLKKFVKILPVLQTEIIVSHKGSRHLMRLIIYRKKIKDRLGALGLSLILFGD
jgi:hypothetical protein